MKENLWLHLPQQQVGVATMVLAVHLEQMVAEEVAVVKVLLVVQQELAVMEEVLVLVAELVLAEVLGGPVLAEVLVVLAMQISIFFLLFPLMLVCLEDKVEVVEEGVVALAVVEQQVVVERVYLYLSLVWVMAQEEMEVLEVLVVTGEQAVQAAQAATAAERQVFV
tara:strand:- start:9 stop:506 length:498 start_codon:yes stop_codon:yes gene_type:complete